MAAPISPQELVTLHLLEAAVGGRSLIEYIPRVSKQLRAPWHLHPIANLFARAEMEEVRACVSVPPRHGKTEMLLHAVSWWLQRHPTAQVAYISYSQEFANEKSRRALNIARQSGLKLNDKVQRSNYWETIHGGSFRAVGIGGGLTGHGVDLMLIDDPIKNREEAESVRIRERNWDWFTSTAMTRIEPHGSVITVHTRWHDDDLIGRLTQSGWENVNLPCVAEMGDPLGREPGQVLWPSQWTAKAMKIRRREVGAYDWASMFQGQPRPRGGRMFEDAHYYDQAHWETGRPLIACDPAATAKTSADYSAIVVGYGYLDPRSGMPAIDIVDVWRGQVPIPQLANILVQCQKHWGAPVVVEAVGGFKAVPQMIRQIDKQAKVIGIQPTTDKFTRALPAAAAWNDGRVKLPSWSTPWKQTFLNEVNNFTGVSDVHDDMVDALAHLYQQMVTTLPHKGLGLREQKWQRPAFPVGRF